MWFPVENKGGYLLGSSMFRASANSRITRFMYSGQYSRRPYWRAASHSLFNSSLSQIMVFLRLGGFTVFTPRLLSLFISNPLPLAIQPTTQALHQSLEFQACNRLGMDTSSTYRKTCSLQNIPEIPGCSTAFTFFAPTLPILPRKTCIFFLGAPECL